MGIIQQGMHHNIMYELQILHYYTNFECGLSQTGIFQDTS